MQQEKPFWKWLAEQHQVPIGYGEILRIQLEGSARESVVAKHIRLPLHQDHPRGWNTGRSHQRKVRSYEVEVNWYRDWSPKSNDHCRTPCLLACDHQGEETFMVLEDLDTAGFSQRRTEVSSAERNECLRWLAHFHATFLTEEPTGLWPTGTYWHLETRPDELEALEDPDLKKAATAIDRRLNKATWQTLVHGDAKLANFCFSPSNQRVAAVDFQYVGGGCGMKDVAYFIGSCLDEEACEEQEEEILESYFSELREALGLHHPDVNAADAIAEWEALYPFAWTDFHRFLKGWSPGHWKIHSYSERLAREVLATL
ncbi:MAG: phosphotransferase [Verrucomicrobiota bacterium]